MVQSSIPIAGMSEACSSMYPDMPMGSSPYSDVRSNYTLSPISVGGVSPNPPKADFYQRANQSQSLYQALAPPLVSTSIWEIAIGFESPKNCEVVAQHIITARFVFDIVFDTWIAVIDTFFLFRNRSRATRLENVRSFLKYWSDKSSF